MLSAMLSPSAKVPNDRLSKVCFTLRSEAVVGLSDLTTGISAFSFHLNNILTL